MRTPWDYREWVYRMHYENLSQPMPAGPVAWGRNPQGTFATSPLNIPAKSPDGPGLVNLAAKRARKRW
jgi:hypothetical protein